MTEDRLSDVLSEFARTVVTDFPIERILDHLVHRIVDILPIGAAGVSLISPTSDPRLIAGSDESATRYENLQTSLREGPCLAAFENGDPISIPNLAEDDRFPIFAEKALAEGLVAVFTFPLRYGDRCLCALDLYRTTVGVLDERDMKAAQTLADVATAYLLNAQARQAKSEFVATVSHELRTPMASIVGFIELLDDREIGPLNERQELFIRVIRRNSDRLAHLANDLLTLSRLESGTFAHPDEAVDLGRVISSVRTTLEPVIISRGLDVTTDIPQRPVIVFGDAEGLEVVVSNLLSNAVKFTEPGAGSDARCGPCPGTHVWRSATTAWGFPKTNSKTSSRGSSEPPQPKTGRFRARAWA